MDTIFTLESDAPLLERTTTAASYQVTVRVLSRVSEAIAAPCSDPRVALTYWQSNVASAPWFDPEKEHLVVLMLDTKYRVKAWNLVSVGSLNESIAHPREIFRPAIATAAHSILLMHNHPSGEPAPSRADTVLTGQLKEAGKLLNLPLVDHIIVGARGNFHSFADHQAI